MSVLLNCQEKRMTWTCDSNRLERNGRWTALWGLKHYPTGCVLAPNPKIFLTADVWSSARLLFSQLLGNTPRRQIRCLLPLNSSEFPALPYGAWDHWAFEQGTQGHNTVSYCATPAVMGLLSESTYECKSSQMLFVNLILQDFTVVYLRSCYFQGYQRETFKTPDVSLFR